MTYRSGQRFTVLAVSIGNVCRSPAIAHVLRSSLGDGGIDVRSAGTAALVGQPIQPPMVRLLERQGVSVDASAAQAVTESMLAGADLVLTATRELRGDVVEILPSVVRRTYTVREFARLAELVEPADLDGAAGLHAGPAERLAALVPLAAAQRFAVPMELDDVVDPYLQEEAVYEQSFRQIVEAAKAISRVVRSGAERGTTVVGAGSESLGALV